MAEILNLKTFSDSRGNLTVVEGKNIGFDIKRVFFIYGVDDSKRGGHAHKKTIQAAVSLQGSCKIITNDGTKKQEFLLDKPYKCLILEPKDWHYMIEFTPDCILQVFASREYDPEDYIYDEPK